MKKNSIEKFFCKIIFIGGLAISIILREEIHEMFGQGFITMLIMNTLIISASKMYKKYKKIVTAIFLYSFILNILMKFSNIKLIKISIFLNLLVLVFSFLCYRIEKYKKEKR